MLVVYSAQGWPMVPGADFSEERRELARVLASATFLKSPNLARLLDYICTKYFEGTVSDLKEYNVGVEALGRREDFDPTTNSIVRVEVHRLREKLKRLYENEGVGHELIIVLQVGHYVPAFIRREKPIEAAKVIVSGNGPVSGPEPSFSPETRGQPGNGEPVAPTGANRSPTAASWTRRLSLGPSRLFVVLLGLIFVLAALSAWRIKGLRTWVAAGGATAPGGNLRTPATSEGDEVRILAGYSKERYIDRSGKVWYSDRYFHGGTPAYQPLKFMARTLDPVIYETSRVGEFSYDIPLQSGIYELRLYFAETFFGPGTFSGGGESSRVFSINMNGSPLLEEVDPFRDAGGNNVADVRVFKDVSPAPDGQLHLQFRRIKDEPFVNALEIVPGIPGKLHPVRIVARNNSWTDQQDRVWNPDRYFSGGQLVVHRGQVEGTPAPGLFDGERFGNFTYAIPVAQGKYSVTLHFAETYFGPKNAGFGGKGSRIFDVYCNGLALLRNFDIYREAGGTNRALSKTFHGLVPTAGGKLILSFVPTKNYALVNAIEVNDESE